MHRSENTDDPSRLSSIVTAFNALDEPVVFPVHPRTRKAIAGAGCQLGPHVQLIDPVGYLDMVALTGSARLVLTDSGGLQKEAYWLGVPCVTLRDETEWVETVESGWNTLVGSDIEDRSSRRSGRSHRRSHGRRCTGTDVRPPDASNCSTRDGSRRVLFAN